MQCPSCGFENIPGRVTCGFCAGALGATAPGATTPAGVFPPRARDRKLRDHVRNRLARVHLAGVGAPRARPVAAAVRKDGAVARWRAGGLPASMVPGLGFLMARADRVTARRHMIASLCAVVLAALLYRTRLADVLLLSVMMLSIASVTVAVAEGKASTERAPGQALMGIGLITFAVYVGTYVLSTLLLAPWLTMGDARQADATQRVLPGDTVLFGPSGGAGRGDIVMGTSHLGINGYVVPSLGAVAGLPGETVAVDDGGHVFVNGRLTSVNLGSVGREPLGEVRSVTLGPGEIWAYPTQVEVNGVDSAGMVAYGGTMSASNARRALAVVNPPGRRAILRRQPIFASRR